MLEYQSKSKPKPAARMLSTAFGPSAYAAPGLPTARTVHTAPTAPTAPAAPPEPSALPKT